MREDKSRTEVLMIDLSAMLGALPDADETHQSERCFLIAALPSGR